MHLAWWAEPREMYLSAGICDRQVQRSVRFLLVIAIDPLCVLGIAG